MRNLNVAVREWEEQVVFLHKIVEGAADKSYGIHVARLAGVPREVNERAKEILAHLEQDHLELERPPKNGPQQLNPPHRRSATHPLRAARAPALEPNPRPRSAQHDAAQGAGIA